MKSSELLMFQDVWRQAFRKGQMDCKFKSTAGAQRARMQLYNSVKKQKAGEDMEDLELVHAAEQLEIVWVNEEKTIFRLQKRASGDMMQGLMAALGRDVKEYVDPEAIASAERLLKELGGMGQGEGAEPRPGDYQDNPFYGKRG